MFCSVASPCSHCTPAREGGTSEGAPRRLTETTSQPWARALLFLSWFVDRVSVMRPGHAIAFPGGWLAPDGSGHVLVHVLIAEAVACATSPVRARSALTHTRSLLKIGFDPLSLGADPEALKWNQQVRDCECEERAPARPSDACPGTSRPSSSTAAGPCSEWRAALCRSFSRRLAWRPHPARQRGAVVGSVFSSAQPRAFGRKAFAAREAVDGRGVHPANENDSLNSRCVPPEGLGGNGSCSGGESENNSTTLAAALQPGHPAEQEERLA